MSEWELPQSGKCLLYKCGDQTAVPMHRVKAGHDGVPCSPSSGEVETTESREVSSLAKYARSMFSERPCI